MGNNWLQNKLWGIIGHKYILPGKLLCLSWRPMTNLYAQWLLWIKYAVLFPPAYRLVTDNTLHMVTKQGEERLLRRETVHRCFKTSRVSFEINTDTLPPSEVFPYLGHTITYNISNWAAVYLNLCKAWRRRGMI